MDFLVEIMQGDQTALFLKGALYTGHLPCIALFLIECPIFLEKMVFNESFPPIYFWMS